jgi:hypothetical protein
MKSSLINFYYAVLIYDVTECCATSFGMFDTKTCEIVTSIFAMFVFLYVHLSVHNNLRTAQ